MELIRRLLVGLLGMIDAVVYDLVGRIYNLLIGIANANLFSEEIFETFADRVYALLGLFMLFKVSFSLIKYIVNPDDFNDKAKGGKKMIMNILVVLILMVATPMAFKEMRKLQQILLDEQVVEKLILGGGVNGETVDMGTMGETIKMEVFRAFYEIKGDVDPSVLNAYNDAYQRHSVWDMIHEEVNNEPIFMARTKDGKDYAVNYMFIVSTVAGIFTGWIFLVFCIDIAIRTVKLGFLQLISPIPIISYIDPSSSKNGMFSKWLKQVGRTYIDLFIRLGAVYFAIALISSLIGNSDLGSSNVFIKAFVIIGILVFANQIPKLLEDLLGIKLDTDFSLNPMKKVNASPIASAAVGGAVGLGLGAAANLTAAPGRLKDFKAAMDKTDPNTGQRAGFKGAITNGKGFSLRGGWNALTHARNTLTPFAGGASAMVRGAIAGSTGKGSAIKAGVQGATISSKLRNARQGGYGLGDKIYDRWTDVAGIKQTTGTTNLLEDKIKANQMQISNYKRDEQSYSQQLADLARSNPRSYNEAFEATILRDENGDIKRDDDGNIEMKRVYQNYDDYIMNKTGTTEAMIQSGISSRIASGQFANDAVGQAAARDFILGEQARSNGLISRREYDDYAVVQKARDDADSGVRKLEKRNKELQGYLDAKSGKPKK